MRASEREWSQTLNNPTTDHQVPDRLSNRKAGALLLAFLAAVIVVAAFASIPLTPTERSSTEEPVGKGQLRLVDLELHQRMGRGR